MEQEMIESWVTPVDTAISFGEVNNVGLFSTSKQGQLKAVPASGQVYRYASRTEDNSTPEELSLCGCGIAPKGVLIGEKRYAFRQSDGGLLILQLPPKFPKKEKVDIIQTNDGEIITAFIYWDTCSLGVKSSHISLFGPE